MGGAESRRLTLIVADSGYGKSTLLAQWGETVPGVPQVWYALRTRDALARHFERHLVSALAHIASLHRSARSVAEAVDALEADAILVLDDLHHLTDRGLAVLQEMLEHPLLHVVAASRTLPALPLARLRIQGQVLELTAADLAFTLEEIAALGLQGDPGEWWRQTQGWPAAFALIEPATTPQAASSRTDLFNLLAEEVWSRLSDSERLVLQAAAVAAAVTPDMVAALLGEGEQREALELFVRRGWLAVTAPDRFQCHSLFRDFVRQRMDAAERAVLAERAVAWWVERGSPEEAAGISALCGPAFRRQFLLEHGSEVTRTGGASALREALEGLPYDPDEPPRVTALRGRLEHLEGKFAAALEWLAVAREQAGRAAEWRALAHAAATSADILSQRGEYAEAARTCREALAQIAGRDPRAQAELEGIMPWSLFHLGRIEEAIETVERARRWYEEHGIVQSEAQCIRRRGAFHSMRGELAEALRWEGLAVVKFRQVRDALGEANSLLNLGATLGRAGRYEDARAQMQTALAVAERAGLSGIALNIKREMAGLAAEAGGDPDPVPAAHESGRELFLWHLAAAHAARRRGDLHQAWRELGAARALLPGLSEIFRTSLDVEEGALRLMQGEVEPALRLLDPAVETLWNGPWRASSYLPRLHRAHARLRMGGEEDARSDLGVLLDWRGQADLAALWAPEAWAARPLLEFAVRARLEPAFAGALLRVLTAAPSRGPATIRVDILGALRATREGSVLREDAFARPQVRAFLGYLAAHHPRSVPAGELLEALWPQSPASGESSLYTTVSRLRRALGRDAVLKDGAGYRLSDAVEVDRILFDRALAAQPPRPAEALALWRGDLLADLPLAEWAFLLRDSYRSRFVEAAVRYGESLLAQKKFDDARGVFERALAADAFCEPAVQGQMRVLILTGDAPRAQRLFQRFSEALQRELGVPPSEETLLLARRLAG